jgi:ketosteroid isomerase-like protein
VPPTEDDLARIRRLFETFSARFEEIKAGQVDAFFAEYYTEDALLESPDAFPAPMDARGVEGYREFITEAYGPYEGVTWELEEADVVGETIVARALIRGRAVGDPLEIEVRVALVYELRDGRIFRSRLYLSHERALDAARADAAA